MPGPLPKNQATRRRTNRPRTLSDAKPSKVPSLPDRDEPWHGLTVEWWGAVWQSPMASEWIDADYFGLLVAAAHWDCFWKTGKTAAATEARLQEQRYGIAPYDRRRLDWKTPTDEPERPKRQRRAASKDDDPRAALGS